MSTKPQVHTPKSWSNEGFITLKYQNTGFTTGAIIAVPIPSADNKGGVIGVLEMMNSRESRKHFSDSDERWLTLFAKQLGIVISKQTINERLTYREKQRYFDGYAWS